MNLWVFWNPKFDEKGQQTEKKNFLLKDDVTVKRDFTIDFKIRSIASWAIWLSNIVSYIKRGMLAKVIWNQDPEANILAQEGWEWGLKKAPQWGTSCLYRSPNIVRVIISRRLRWAEHVARMEEGRSAFKILTGKPTGKRPLGRPGRRWEDHK